MICKNPSIKKAVLTFMVGMAFFFSACQTGQVGSGAGRSLTGYSGAVADYEAGRYERALDAFDKILKDRPNHPEIHMVRYYQAFCYYYTGDNQKAVDLVTGWIKDNPDRPELYKMQKLAGDASKAAGQTVDACSWMLDSLKTASASGVSGSVQKFISDSIYDLIAQGSEDDLKQIRTLDSITPFLSSIYLKQAEIALDDERYQEAKKLASLSIRVAGANSQPELEGKGREFLDLIEAKIKEKGIADVKEKQLIGCLLPLQGKYSLFGEEYLNGIQLGMDIFNSSNEDVYIELIVKNTNVSSEDTLKAVEELIKDNVIAIIGPVAMSSSTAAAKKAQEHGVPIITFTQKENIIEEGNMVFRNFLTPSSEINTLLKKAVNDYGMTRFGIFYPETTYGKSLMELFWNKVEEMGGEITAVESYNAKDTDFSDGIKKMVGLYYPRPESLFKKLKAEKLARLEKIKSKLIEESSGESDGQLTGAGLSGTAEAVTAIETVKPETTASNEAMEEEAEDPLSELPDEAAIEEEAKTDPIIDFDAVFIPDDSQNIAQIAPQFPFNGIFNVPFLGTRGWMSDELINSTSEYLQYAMFPVGFFADEDSEMVERFVEKYRAAYGKEPGLLAATGYDTIKMIREVLNVRDIATRSDFRDALEEYDMYEGVTGDISFDNRGEVEKTPRLLMVFGKKLYMIE